MSAVISRRETIAGISASFVLAGILPVRADELAVVRVGVLPIFAVAAHFAAEKQGYFAQEGVAAMTQTVAGGAAGISGLAGGSFDVLYANSISCFTALDQGIDLRFIAEGAPVPTQPPDPGALMIRKGENLKTGKDFEGRTIGINAKYDLQWLTMHGWVTKTGGDNDKVAYREVPLPSMLDAIRSKQVDGALVLDPFMTMGLGDPALERVAWPLSTALPGLPTSFWMVSASAAENKAPLIRRYLKAFLKGGEWINAHLRDDAYNQLIASYTKTDPKLIAQMVASNQPMSVDVDAGIRLAGIMKQNGLLKTDIDFKAKQFS